MCPLLKVLGPLLFLQKEFYGGSLPFDWPVEDMLGVYNGDYISQWI